MMYNKFSVKYLSKFICLSFLFFLAFIAVLNLNLSKANASVIAAPHFTLKVLNRSASGYDVFSLNNYKGHIVVLNFWATWCPPCRAEMPMLAKFYNLYKVKGVIVVGINVNNNIGGVSRFLKLYGISYPVVYANPDIISEYGGINEIPQTFFISKSGKIMFHWIGQISHSLLYGITNKLLKMN
ncbi:MAG: TlpA family protein disulfide reductase [Deltaproteobacteria bacterium]|nr:TlpA family protein disulfide reductase [Deltaproteobacteria bacterium]